MCFYKESNIHILQNFPKGLVKTFLFEVLNIPPQETHISLVMAYCRIAAT